MPLPQRTLGPIFALESAVLRSCSVAYVQVLSSLHSLDRHTFSSLLSSSSPCVSSLPLKILLSSSKDLNLSRTWAPSNSSRCQDLTRCPASKVLFSAPSNSQTLSVV
ncbi:hypothetical protein B0H12DRAFT_1135679 [Mycena haematopus]|nr:hypothetical protein B0H12DRAFT_1135679 [Mycena haematopus]